MSRSQERTAEGKHSRRGWEMNDAHLEGFHWRMWTPAAFWPQLIALRSNETIKCWESYEELKMICKTQSKLWCLRVGFGLPTCFALYLFEIGLFISYHAEMSCCFKKTESRVVSLHHLKKHYSHISWQRQDKYLLNLEQRWGFKNFVFTDEQKANKIISK